MKNISLFLLFISLVTTVAGAQIVDIPDANFKNALVNFDVADIGNGTNEDVDTNNDGEIQVSEAEAVIELTVGGFDIASLIGIESFTGMEYLNCVSNELTELDLSQNLLLREVKCDQNEISELNVSQNISLEVLSCISNMLGVLDVSNNSALTELNCGSNNLSALDISQNTQLILLSVTGTNLTTIDVSNNGNLEDLKLNNNSIIQLDVTQNTSLKRLGCAQNSLTELDVSLAPDLDFINCAQNQLSELDLSQNSLVRIIRCQDNQLTSLNIQNGNNGDFFFINATNNSKSLCIQVDDLSYALSQVCDLGNIEGWCKDAEADYSEDCNLGFHEIALGNNITLCPNPVNDVLYVDKDHDVSIKSIKVYDTLGKLVLTPSRDTDGVSFSQFQSGMYFIHISTDLGEIAKKVIKQ